MKLKTSNCSLDDPVTWGVLPAKWYFNSRMTRWSLGASDIMFTNPYVLLVRSAGKPVPMRGQPVPAPAVAPTRREGYGLLRVEWVDSVVHRSMGVRTESVSSLYVPYLRNTGVDGLQGFRCVQAICTISRAHAS